MNLIEQIYDVSPWLREPEWQKNDRHLVKARNSGIQFRHTRQDIEFERDSISIIRGPRQIGKTTECKLMIESMLAQGRSPYEYIYFPCDNILNRKELIDVIAASIEISQQKSNMPLTLFLDEITSVKQWYKAIKWAQDTGMLSDIALVLTGSSAYEMKRGYDRMPGRRGSGKDVCLLPMDFCSFIKSCDSLEMEPVNFGDTLKSEDAFRDFKISIARFQHSFLRRLNDYLVTGGFPFAVSSLRATGCVTDSDYEIIISAISSEIEKQKRSTETLRQILAGLDNAKGNPVSLTHIAQSNNIASMVTVKEYIELLYSSFIVLPVPSLDISKKAPFPKKDRKYYFTDPLISQAIQKSFRGNAWVESQLAEAVVSIALIRKFAAQWAKWGFVDSLYHYKTTSGKEIDFVINNDGSWTGFEVKYQTRVSGWDEMQILRSIGRGILITKDDFTFGKVPRIPLWAFLTMTL